MHLSDLRNQETTRYDSLPSPNITPKERPQSRITESATKPGFRIYQKISTGAIMTTSRNSIAQCPLCGSQKGLKQLVYHLQIVHNTDGVHENPAELHSNDEISRPYRSVEQNE
jgi:hypothetical protein